MDLGLGKYAKKNIFCLGFLRVGIGGRVGFFDKKDRQIILSKPNDMKSVAFDFVGDSEVRIGF